MQPDPLKSSLQLHSAQKIKAGSLSFHFAASLLEKRARDAIFLLYSWCRECDDMIDSAENASHTSKTSSLNTIKALTFTHTKTDNLSFLGMRKLFSEYNIPKYYAEQLVWGMELDIIKSRYQNMDELLEYCFCVAGTVGLMSCHILGVKNLDSLKNAESLGIAMQLTNIVRDVRDDERLGRIYLPVDLLERCSLVKAVEYLLKVADEYYEAGFAGTIFLPWRAAFAVYTAGLIYQDIGRVIRQKGEKAWDSRSFVPKMRKIQLASIAMLKIFSQIPQRILIARKNVPITIVRQNSWSNS